MSAPVVVDLFAGPGGWDVAARELGLDPIGVEWDFDACRTAEAAGHRRVPADIADLDPAQFVTEHAGDAQVAGLIASPPCQAFSVAGRGRGRAGAAVILDGVARIAAGDDPRTVCKAVDAALDDDRAALVLEPLRWALDLEPQWLAFEQVPPVLPLWEAFAEVLRADGYNVETGWLTAEQFDVPQTRKRAFLIAHRDLDVHLPPPVRRKYHKGIAQHEGDPALLPWLSMADALGWGMTERPSMTATAGGTATGGAEVFGNAARQGMRREADAGRWVFERPATTVQGDLRLGRPGHKHRGPDCCKANGDAGVRESMFAEGSVRVTVAEAAALQGFPEDYPWQGRKGAQFRQVGDAVPPPLAWHVLRAAMGGAA